MRYSFITAAILALSATVYAQTAGFDVLGVSPSQDETVAAGSSLDIKWTYTPDPRWPASDTVTLTLLQGSTPSTLQIGPVIQAGVNNTLESYIYNIPGDSGSYATYGIKISLDSDPTIFQYSYPFHITSASTSSASLTGATSTVTMHLSTGTAYATAISSSSSANVTSTVSKSSNTTIVTSTSTSAPVTGASNATLSTSATPTTAKTTGSGSSASSTSSSAVATLSHSAAVANMAKGSFAVLGGVVLALVL